jgi:predicted ribosome quality control (RQC) complex YloA/Tae2 family protein
MLSAKANAQKYFEKYNKQKRTFEALSEFIISTKADLDHLDTINVSLDIAMNEEDLHQLRQELIDSGYMKRKIVKGKKPKKIVGKPLRFVSNDGFEIYVGKNNYQNDELTFKEATGNDWWFHAKGMAGSHVIVKANNQELPDTTFVEAASLAAFYSKGKINDKVEIDYTQKKNIKKPTAAKPGFVIYNTYHSMVVSPKSEITK